MRRNTGRLGSLGYLRVGVWQTIPKNKCGEPGPQDQRANNSQSTVQQRGTKIPGQTSTTSPSKEFANKNWQHSCKYQEKKEFRNAPLHQYNPISRNPIAQNQPDQSFMINGSISYTSSRKQPRKDKKIFGQWHCQDKPEKGTVSQSQTLRPTTRPMLGTTS